MRWPRARPPGAAEKTTGAALLGWAASYSAGPGRPAQVIPLPLFFFKVIVFYFCSVCFDLVGVLNKFICFCKLLYGLEILF